MFEHDDTTRDRLLEHVGWIRKLARRLVEDANTAEDLVQDVCIVALERPPRSGERFQAWLSSVMHNWVRQHGRGESRRTEREQRVSRAERTESTAGIVERVSVQRELVQAVLDLDEPYQTAIVWRFFDNLPPREIAARLGVPPTTVQSRLTRGLARLRDRLDERHESRAAWLAPLASIAGPGTGVPPAAGTPAPAGLVSQIGGLLMSTKWLAAAGALALVAGVVAVARFAPGGTPAEPTGNAVVPDLVDSPMASAQGRPEERVDDTQARAPVAAPIPGVAPPKTAASTARTFVIQGRVLDASAQPLGGVPIGAAGTEDPLCVSEAGGWFEVEMSSTSASSGRLEALDEDWATLRTGAYELGTDRTPLVVVAPAIEIAGRVFDEFGLPLGGAHVRFELPEDFTTRFDESFESGYRVDRTAISAEDGTFHFPVAASIAGAALTGALEGFQPMRIDAPLVSDLGAHIVLAEVPRAREGVVRGRVSDHRGQAVAAARVAMGVSVVLTDDEGEFVIERARTVSDSKITAIKEGHLPAALTRTGEETWPSFVELTLGGPPLAIQGRVVDRGGRPRPGLRVWLADPTPFAAIGDLPIQRENIMAGVPIPADAFSASAEGPEEDGDGFWDMTQPAGAASAFWNWVATDSEGRFEIGGLEDRDYRLRVMDDDTLVVTTSDPIAAGSIGVDIPLPEPKLHARLRGRVIGDNGRPVAGVRVGLRRVAFERTQRVWGGRVQMQSIQSRENVTTDEAGRFEFERVPAEGAYLLISADGVVPRRFVVPEEVSGDLSVPVETRCRFELHVAPPAARADRFRVLDAEGEVVDIRRMDAGSDYVLDAWPLVEGRSGVVSISARARTLELWAQDELVGTHPLHLDPGQVARLDL